MPPHAPIVVRQAVRYSLALLVAIALSHTVAAVTSAERTELLAAHNAWRRAVSVPAVRWSPKLETRAQKWADYLKSKKACGLVHSSAADVGENLFKASAIMGSDGKSTQRVVTAAHVTDSWGAEKDDYTYASNRCAPGKSCGHYTQMVWKATTEVGCGRAVCRDNSQVWVCNYAPAGNWTGEKPY